VSCLTEMNVLVVKYIFLTKLMKGGD